MPPCRLRRRKFWIFDYEMVHSEVYVKCGQHSAVLYTCLPWLLSKYNINIENCSFFACFRFLIFRLFFQGVQLTPFAPVYGRPCERVCVCMCLSARENLRNCTSDLHQIFCALYLWPWLGPALAACWYVMYFRFYGQRHKPRLLDIAAAPPS